MAPQPLPLPEAWYDTLWLHRELALNQDLGLVLDWKISLYFTNFSGFVRDYEPLPPSCYKNMQCYFF